MTTLITQIPFLIELLGDAWLISKKKKDIHWTVRCCLIVVVCLVYGWGDVGQTVRGLVLSVAPFCFFDVLLNVLRKKNWYYLGTKKWDTFLKKFNPWFLLVVRMILFIGCLIIGL